jgi:DnaD/phage-associated family protein
MSNFAGFPAGKNPFVPVPEAFFTQVLPEIEDSAELKVTLHLFWLLAKKQGNPRCVSEQELLADRTLLRGLKRRGDPRPSEERLRQGLEQGVARGTLLRVPLRLVSEGGDEAETICWYFFNTARSRKVVAELQGGEMIPVRLLKTQEEPQESNQVVVAGTRGHTRNHLNGRQVHVEIERPNIFVLYEQNIGLLSPLIADELKEAADHFPAEWIEAAFREAVQYNKRKWSYIRAILRRWETEGRQ